MADSKEFDKIKLSNLIKDPKLEELSLGIHSPNIFSILSIEGLEIRHSNFLAWLMSPNESHNLNTIFIKWFLKEIFTSEKVTWASEFSVEGLSLNNIEIFREWKLPESKKRIDILIEHKDFVIVIENKIYSTEHMGQLKGYKKAIDKKYPKHKKAFIYLTIDGEVPRDEDDANNYVPVDYGIIESILEIILSVYKESLSQRIQYYIEDYLITLRRFIMKNDDSAKLAVELYRNHKEAIDFIIESKPDTMADIKEIIKSSVAGEGYNLETCNKYYVRFLTKKLSVAIPRTGIGGWKGNESFLFEIEYWEKGVSLKFVVSPGNEENRELLVDIIKSLPGSKKSARGQHWLTFYSDPRRVKLIDKLEEDGKIDELIKQILKDNKNLIEKVESEVLKIADKFVK